MYLYVSVYKIGVNTAENVPQKGLKTDTVSKASLVLAFAREKLNTEPLNVRPNAERSECKAFVMAKSIRPMVSLIILLRCITQENVMLSTEAGL